MIFQDSDNALMSVTLFITVVEEFKNKVICFGQLILKHLYFYSYKLQTSFESFPSNFFYFNRLEKTSLLFENLSIIRKNWRQEKMN